jgi:hypothetical protein
VVKFLLLVLNQFIQVSQDTLNISTVMEME